MTVIDCKKYWPTQLIGQKIVVKTGDIKSFVFWGNTSTKQNRALCMASEAAMIHNTGCHLEDTTTCLLVVKIKKETGKLSLRAYL